MGLGDDGASAFAQSGRLALLCGMLIIWPLIVVMAILVKVKMPPCLLFSARSAWARTGSCSLAIEEG